MTMTVNDNFKPAIQYKTINVDKDCYDNLEIIKEMISKKHGFQVSTKQTMQLIVKYQLDMMETEALRNGAG